MGIGPLVGNKINFQAVNRDGPGIAVVLSNIFGIFLGKSMPHSLQVHCVCGGFGFPVGTASTKRVMLMGRALHSAGVAFRVWHLGPSSHSENTRRNGVEDGVSWEYLSPKVRRPANRWVRAFYFVYGCIFLPFRLARLRRDICVYVYYQGNMIDLWALFICRLLNIPVAQECCEWWPGTPDETRFIRWMYQNIMFRWSTGALPISKLIEERIKKLARSDYPVLRVPVLVDADEVSRERNHPPTTPGADQPYLFWCGMVDGYIRDPVFLIQILGEVGRRYALRPCLVLAGPCSDAVREELLSVAEAAGLEQGQVIATGFIPEVELFRLATHAVGALLPLWDDDRSATRFPTKLGLYAAACRPVVASPIGEISHYLRDRETVLFAPAGDESAWADAVATLMKDADLCAQLVDRMQSEVLPLIEYRSVGPILKEWFVGLYQKSSNSRRVLKQRNSVVC